METQSMHPFSVIHKPPFLLPIPKLSQVPKMIFLLFLMVNVWYNSTCPASTSSPSAISTVQDTFSGRTNTYTHSVKLGPVSKSLYYMHPIVVSSSPDVYNAALRKINPDNSLAWVTSISFDPLMKSLTIDSTEKHVYFGSLTNPLDVCRLSTDTGIVVDSQR